MRPLSYSSLHMFDECPQRWYLKYVALIPEKPKYFFSFGKTLHAVLEYFHDPANPTPPTLDELLAKFREEWITGEGSGWQGLAQEESYKNKGEKILRDYHAKFKESFKPARAVELKFELDVDGVPVIGYIDRIDDLPDGTIRIMDYKTGQKVHLDREHVHDQLTMYQMACEETLGVRVGKLVFYHLHPDKQTEHPFERRTEQDVLELRKNIVRIARKIEEYRSQLAAWQDLQKLKHELILTEGESGLKASRGRKKLKLDPLTPADIRAQIDAREQEPYIPHFPTKGYPQACTWCDFKDRCPAWGAHPAVEGHKGAEPIEDEKSLERKIDEYGKLKEQIHEKEQEAEALHDLIVASLRHRGLDRFESKHFTASMHGEAKWEFTKSSREKAKQEIRSAGRWEQILGPTWSKVQDLMGDSSLPLELRDRLQKLGVRVMHYTLRVTKADEPPE